MRFPSEAGDNDGAVKQRVVYRVLSFLEFVDFLNPSFLKDFEVWIFGLLFLECLLGDLFCLKCTNIMKTCKIGGNMIFVRGLLSRI